MGASNSKNDRRREASYGNDDTPRKRRRTGTCDEEAERQSAVNSVRIETKPVHSSPEVLELRQYLLMAKQAQLNAEQLVINTAQQLLDTEQQAAKKEETYQSELREAVLRAEQAEKELDSAREVASEKAMLEAKVNQLEEKEKRSYQLICELTNEVEEEKKKVSESEKSIEELKRKLAGDEGSGQEVVEIAEDEAVAGCYAEVHLIPPLPNDNILALVSPSYEKSISIDEAVKQLRVAVKECKEVFRCTELPAKYNCYACGRLTLALGDKLKLLYHFLSKGHINKVRTYGAAVSHPALSTWLNILKQFSKKERIEQLKHKLSGNEAGVPKVVEIADVPAKATVRIDRSVDNFAQPTNIFRLLRPASNAISLDEAVERVRVSFEKCGEKARKRCEEKATNFDCRLCGIEMPNKLAVTTHFLSEEHIGKVRASGASVSKTAISNWANMLDNLAEWEKSLTKVSNVARWRHY